MQDRYLFKAKRKDDGKWVHGYLFDDGFENGRVFIGGIVIEKYNGTACDDWNVTGINFCEIDPNTICQCTGLKDKNGKLIWENDIIKKEFYTDYDAYANSEKYTGVMKYEDGGWWVKTLKEDGQILARNIIDVLAFSKDIEHFEVIGNVFDNPELWRCSHDGE